MACVQACVHIGIERYFKVKETQMNFYEFFCLKFTINLHTVYSTRTYCSLQVYTKFTPNSHVVHNKFTLFSSQCTCSQQVCIREFRVRELVNQLSIDSLRRPQ